MPDRIIRDEILLSDRWIDLPTDTHRLIYAALLLRADDYGNLEGGPRRLYRWMHSFSQIKSEADSIKLMSDLQDAEMVLRYEAGGKEYWHVTRFKNSRWYWKRACPQSPYPDDVTNEEKQRPSEKRNTHVADTLPTRREGVGVGVVELPSPRPSPDPRNKATWLAFCAAYANRYGVAPVQNASVNSCIANIVKRLGNEAPDVAAFFLSHNDQFYVKKRHQIKQLLADAEGLRTQWKTGRKSTTLEARSAEQRDGLHEQYKRLIESEK